MELVALGKGGLVLGPEIRVGWLESPTKNHPHHPVPSWPGGGAEMGPLLPTWPAPPSLRVREHLLILSSPWANLLSGKCPTNTFTLTRQSWLELSQENSLCKPT